MLKYCRTMAVLFPSTAKICLEIDVATPSKTGDPAMNRISFACWALFCIPLLGLAEEHSSGVKSGCSGTVSNTVAVEVANVRAVCRNGQTFVTWKDVAEGEAGAQFRYSVYRSEKPIAPDLANAERCMTGVMNNSAKLFGEAFYMKDRLDPEKPMAVIETGGAPLPFWSGLAVVTVKNDGRSYYAVAATDEKGVTQGKSGMTAAPVEERVAPILPIKLEDSNSRKGPSIAETHITGKKGLPLYVPLHESSAAGGGAGAYGDYYEYFSRPEWGRNSPSRWRSPGT